MALNSYFYFAENDFQYFKASYDAGIVANMMGAMAQGICEKYMKHLISEYYKPDDAIQQKDFENSLLKQQKDNENAITAETLKGVFGMFGNALNTAMDTPEGKRLLNDSLKSSREDIEKG